MLQFGPIPPGTPYNNVRYWFLFGNKTVIDGCTTFRLNPFRRIDNSSNTTIRLKKGSGTTIRLKNKDFRRIVAPVLFFGKEHTVVWGWDFLYSASSCLSVIHNTWNRPRHASTAFVLPYGKKEQINMRTIV